MDYSRKNTHTPDGWQQFLTSPSEWISHTARAPSCLDFQAQGPPSCPDFHVLKALIGNKH